MIINITKKYVDNQAVFYPAYDSDKEAILKLPVGQIWQFKPVRKRNLRHHNKFMAMLRMVVANTEKWNSVDELLMHLKYKLGIGDIAEINGVKIFMPRSTSFETMNEDEFTAQIYNPAIHIMAEMMELSIEDMENNFGEYL